MIYFYLLFLTQAFADIEAGTAVRHYDDSKTQVTSPHLEVKAAFWGDRATIGAGYAMDLVSSASSDVVSYASKRIEETRKEISTNLGWLADGGSYSWAYINSKENDYESHTYAVGATKEFFEKNTVVGFGFAYGDDEITSSANEKFQEFMTNHTYSLSLTQVLNRLSVIQFLYDFRIENGYTASPYRKARLSAGDGSISTVPENHPMTRNRNAAAIKYNFFYRPMLLALSTNFRFYFDSWGVMSYTLEERVTRDLSKWLSLAFNLRYYTQQNAKFYKDFYPSDPGPFYTGNKTLATYDTLQLGVRPLFTFSDQIKGYLKAEYYLQNFRNHTDIGSVSDPNDDKKLKIAATVFGLGIESNF